MKNKLWSVCFDNDFDQEIGHKFKITSIIFYFKDFIFDPVTLWKDVSLNPFTPEECISNYPYCLQHSSLKVVLVLGVLLVDQIIFSC